MDVHSFKGILHYVWFVSLLSCTHCSEFECYNTVSHPNGTIEDTLYCCNNAEMRNGKCKGCGVGYKADEGGPCLPCSDNHHGLKCVFPCNCPEWKSCHHVRGCITVPTTTVYTDLKENVTFGVVSQKYTVNIKQSTRIPYNDIISTITRTSEEKNTGDIFSNDIVIYSTCIGGLLIVITFCYACFRFWQKMGISKAKNESEPQNSNENLINTGTTERQETAPESIYHEIDDNDVLNQFQLENHVDFVNTGNHYLELDPDGYISSDTTKSNRNSVCLNTYQPVIEYTDVHKYTTKVNIPYANLVNDDKSLPDNKSVHKPGGNSSKDIGESDPGHNDYLDPVLSLDSLTGSDQNMSSSEHALNNIQYSEVIGTLHPIGSDGHINQNALSISSECLDICHEVTAISCSNDLDVQNSHLNSENSSSENYPPKNANDRLASSEIHEQNDQLHLNTEDSCSDIAGKGETIETLHQELSVSERQTESNVHHIQYAEITTRTENDHAFILEANF